MKKTALLLALLIGPASAPMWLDADGRGNLQFSVGREVSPSTPATPQRLKLPSAYQTAPPSATENVTFTPTSATFSDDTFNDSDWELIVLLGQPGAGTSTASQQSSGGHPGPFRRVAITVTAAMYGSREVYGIHLTRGAFYYPGISGPVTSIDYSEDALYLGGSTEGQLTGPALRQNGKLYVAANIVTPVAGDWITRSLSGLRASQFVQVGAAGEFINLSSHPDFSSSGSPINLGFVRAKSASAAYQSSFGIDNWTLTINHSVPPDCILSISPIAQALPAFGGAGSVQITAPTSCHWQATSNANWIALTFVPFGDGIGDFPYQVAPNTGPARAGTIAINSQEFSITQADGQSSCVYSTAPGSVTFPGAGGYGRFQVEALPGCAWTVSGTPPWISILKRRSSSGSVADTASGIGDGMAHTIRYGVTTNTGPPRTATISIAGQPFTINQDGVTPGCSFTVSPTSVIVHATEAISPFDLQKEIDVTTSPNCNWMAVSQSAWISVDAQGSDDTETPPAGHVVVQFSADANHGAGRSGTINIAGQTVTISQDGLCSPSSYSLSPFEQIMSSDHGQVRVTAPGACSWEATHAGNWITIDDGSTKGTGSGTINFHVLGPTDVRRSGSISVGGANAYISEAAAVLDANPLCVAAAAIFLGGGDNAKILDLLRSFRDEVLAATPRGRQYTELYYNFSGEAIKQLMFSPTLLLQTRQLLERQERLIESMTGGKVATLEKADLEEIDALLNSFSSGASPEFSAILKQLKCDLRDPKVHAEFGVKVR